MNLLQSFFWIIGIGMFTIGLFLNYGEKFVPAVILQLFRYGRANKSSKVYTWKSIEIPKSWFAHFYLYAVILQSVILYTVLKIYLSPNAAQVATESNVAQILSILGGRDRSESIDATTTALACTLFLLHLCRRLYECRFVHVFSGTQMNILHYVLAFLHYTGAELSIVAHSIGLTSTSSQPLTASTSLEWKLCYKHLNILHYFGIILFIYGSYQQNKAHHQFRQLRLHNSDKAASTKKGKSKEEVNAHRIPVGGMFEQISCPNYWAEVVIYASFCFLFQLDNSTWNYVFLWVVANQITSGVMNHIWYKKTFPDYPKNRKAIIPHVW